MKAVLFFFLVMPFAALAQARKKPAMAGAGGGVQQSIARGESVYRTFCLSCHQADGSGVPGLNPPLTPNAWTKGPKNILIGQVLHGSQGKVEIDGEPFVNNMPPMTNLTDLQIADVLTFVRNSFGNNWSAVKPAEVKTIRAKSKLSK